MPLTPMSSSTPLIAPVLFMNLHESAIEFLCSCSIHTEMWYVAWPTLMAYLRISTHPKIFTHPLSAQEALTNIRTLLQVPHVRPLSEADGFLDVYGEVTGNFPVRGQFGARCASS